MTEPESGEEATLFPKTAGERLREAREAQNLTLAEVAARTRIPMRHLAAIELSDYSGLPSSTYSVGFAKAYARAIGADEVTIGREVRREVDHSPRTPEYEPYDTADPSRLPPRGLATILGIVAGLVVIGALIWYGTNWFNGSGAPAPVAEVAAPTPAPTAAPVAPVVPANGQVTLTATDIVWLRVYDAAGKTLFEGEMKPGDRYDVPAGADRPMINVGRPDKLSVTVNGSAIPPLGTGERAIKDVVVTAEALLARGNATAAPDGAAVTPGGISAAPVATPGVRRATARPSPAAVTPAADNGAGPAPRAGPADE